MIINLSALKTSVILYHLRWNIPENKIIFSEGISLEKFSETSAERLYKKVCKNNFVDEGEPLEVEAHLLINHSKISNCVFNWNSRDSFRCSSHLSNRGRHYHRLQCWAHDSFVNRRCTCVKEIAKIRIESTTTRHLDRSVSSTVSIDPSHRN